MEAVFRPEGLRLADPGRPENALVGKVRSRRYAGETTFYEVELEVGGRLLVAAPVDAAGVGEEVAVTVRSQGPPPRLFAVEER